MPPTLGHGKICYVGLPSADVERSAAFYSAVFGWEIRKRGDGRTAFNDAVGQVSGSFVPDRPPQGEGLLLYIMVDDAAAAVKAIVAHGGEIVQPIGVDAPEITAHFRDPSRQRPRHLPGADARAAASVLTPRRPRSASRPAGTATAWGSGS